MAQDIARSEAEEAAYTWVLDNPPGLDPVCGDNGYPTEIEHQRVEHWFDDVKLTREGMIALAAYVRERWKYADMGYWTETIDKDGAIFYQISTGGWSGNEELMSALRTTFFSFLCFESEFRGGHYVFQIKPWKESNANPTEDTNA